MRTLVIDDSEDALDITEAALVSAGYDDIVTATSGWDALKLLDIGRVNSLPTAVDIMLLDVMMPDMDGIEVCTRVRNDERYADLPIIMVTGLDDMGSLANAFMAGANYHIRKPVNRVELCAHVRTALRLKAELDRRRVRERDLLHFMSNWSERRASVWIDEPTGLFVGEVAEAYLAAAGGDDRNNVTSILALTLDRFDAYRTANGHKMAQAVQSQVALAVRRLTATVGVVTAAYANGTIVLVAPEFDARAAHALGERLHNAISKLRLPNSGAGADGYVAASVATITGNVKRGIDWAHLLTQAISQSQESAHAGGNRVLSSSA